MTYDHAYTNRVRIVGGGGGVGHTVYKYKSPYSLTDDALQKSANTCFTVVGRLK